MIDNSTWTDEHLCRLAADRPAQVRIEVRQAKKEKERDEEERISKGKKET